MLVDSMRREGGGRPDGPRLLFVCQSLPYPPDAGHHLRSYNTLRLLAREFDIRSLFFVRRATRPTEADVRRGLDGVRRFGPAAAMPIPQDGNAARFVWDHLRSAARRVVYTRYMYDSGRFHAELDRALREHDPDLVHVDSLDLSVCLPAVRDLPTVVTHHNIESRLLSRRARAESSAFRRRVLDFQAGLMEEEERTWAPVVDLNVVVSESDGAALEQIAPKARILVVPNGVDTSAFEPGSVRERRGLVFVGPYHWLPNRDAMVYFGETILPRVRERIGDVDVTWVGPSPEKVRREFWERYRIRMTGFVDRIHDYVHSAACYVVPLRIGGGTRLKIVDAWALGSAIVSTSVGCEGLEAHDGHNMIIRDDPDAFADAVADVARDPQLQARLSANGRETAVSRYEWDVLGETMLPAYLSLIGRR